MRILANRKVPQLTASVANFKQNDVTDGKNIR